MLSNALSSISSTKIKKYVGTVMTAIVLLMMSFTAKAQTIWDGTADVSWYSSSKTEFTITTAEQLAGLAQLVNNRTDAQWYERAMSGKTFTLGNDILLNDTTGWRNWADNAPARHWTPIGSITNRSTTYFNGTFDGAGFVVAGIYGGNGDANISGGLFQYVDTAGVIKNLGVTALHVINSIYPYRSGGLVGNNSGTIINSYVTGVTLMVSIAGRAGGLVGDNSGTIINSYVTDVTMKIVPIIPMGEGNHPRYVGGFVVDNTGTITNSYAAGDITATRGITATGDVIRSYVAGFVVNNSGPITNCYVTGNITGDGIAGLVHGNSGPITNSYATGNFTGTIGAAGLVVQNYNNGTITNSYAAGNLTGTRSAGLVLTNNGTISNSYYNSETAGVGVEGDYETPRTTAQMKQQSTYTDWNFSSVWGIDASINNGYPYLRTIGTSVSVLSPNRTIPSNNTNWGETVIAPVNALTGEFTAGPNPVTRSSESVKFFRQGKRIQSAALTIFDASGNVINKIKITDNALNKQTRREVGSWDLTDRKGRLVPDGTYLVRGVVTTSDGKKERVSVMVGVR